jgi:hypothetical protein
MVAGILLWAVATIGLLWLYPATNHILVALSLAYVLLYVGVSIYRTFFPLTVDLSELVTE